mmetsp:Transcript_5747/g.12294  ORF Transcript_5747/g.12294 Transcript_5747/m.12294 type:complete len:125 (+) Transcript_5747:69-443(+)
MSQAPLREDTEEGTAESSFLRSDCKTSSDGRSPHRHDVERATAAIIVVVVAASSSSSHKVTSIDCRPSINNPTKPSMRLRYFRIRFDSANEGKTSNVSDLCDNAILPLPNARKGTASVSYCDTA